ncbi:MAG: dolichyl-phosphate beta-glucosyltransferase [Thermoguttaceae bacterium]
MLTETITLSLVLPAYNEAARLPPYLAAVRRCLDRSYAAGYEVIVVDDGSDDGLLGILAQAGADWPQLRAIRHARNQGKGAAVRTGMLAARGELLLFADADGAAPIEEHARLVAAIRAGADLAAGSRLLTARGIKPSRNWLRALAGRLFAAVARRLLRLPVRDTQCGFKMFRGRVARKLFFMAQENRYVFDLEVLALARRFGYRIVEVPIRWTEIPGGHLKLATDWPGILADLWRLYRRLRCRAPRGQTPQPDP